MKEDSCVPSGNPNPDPMIDFVLATPDDFQSNYKQAAGLVNWPLKKWPRGILVLGMGGSGVSGLLLQSLLKKECPVPLIWSRDLFLPAWVDEEWLVVAVSYSGNTWETLQTLQQVQNRKIPWRGVASGGRLKEMADTGEALCLSLDPGRPPRSMSMAALAGLLCLFNDLITGLPAMIDETVRGMREDLSDWRLDSVMNPPQPKRSGDWPVFPRDPHGLAALLNSRFPLFYGWGTMGEAVAYRWMCQMAENAKTPSHIHRLPELLHNEIVAWHDWGCLRPSPVLLRIDMDAKPSNEMDSTPWDRVWREVERAGIEAWAIPSAGGCLPARVLRQVLLGDALSVVLARLKGTAATPVPPIERLKAQE